MRAAYRAEEVPGRVCPPLADSPHCSLLSCAHRAHLRAHLATISVHLSRSHARASSSRNSAATARGTCSSNARKGSRIPSGLRIGEPRSKAASSARKWFANSHRAFSRRARMHARFPESRFVGPPRADFRRKCDAIFRTPPSFFPDNRADHSLERSSDQLRTRWEKFFFSVFQLYCFYRLKFIRYREFLSSIGWANVNTWILFSLIVRLLGGRAIEHYCLFGLFIL